MMGSGYEGGTPPPDGPRNVAGAINGINWMLFSSAWVSVILRIIARVWISHNFGWDDAMMIFCQMTNSVGMGLVMQETFWGLGRHRYYLKTDNFTGFLKYDYLDWCQVFITLMTCKLAICMFLLRISKFKKWRKFLYALIIFLIITHIPIFFIYIFQCKPVNKAWDPDAAPGVCYPKPVIQDIIIVQGVCSILTDIICAAFPIILIRNMKLPQRQRFALQLLMGLGIITAVICTIRTAFSYEVKAKDLTWQGLPNAFCRILEINLGIIAANAPMIRPFWNWGKRRWNQRFHNQEDEANTRQTPPNRLQWYRPPNQRTGTWYQRFRGNFHWGFRPPASKTSSTEAMTQRTEAASPAHSEKATIAPPNPEVPRPSIPSQWPQEYEIKKPVKAERKPKGVDRVKDRDRPANATWAKDEPEQEHVRMSESIDLPLQGVRSKSWEMREKQKIREKGVDWGQFNFHRDAP